MRLSWPLKSSLSLRGCSSKWILITAFITILHNEYLIYWENTLAWPRLQCKRENSSSCQSILIVSDPQILGHRTEPFGFLGFITARDNDMFIRRSFYLAVSIYKPDVIIFLGDLMNEGSSSSDKEYEEFKARFDSIFPMSLLNSVVIYVPGDNDIGGEGADHLTTSKINRFQSHFPSEDVYTSSYSHYITVNRLTADQEFPHVPNNEEKVRIVLSHIPLTFIHGIFSHAVMSKLKPNVIFSAHDHRVAMATTKLDPYTFEFTDLENSMTIQRSLNKEDCIEIIWPTCSYRMGVERSGYGIASISSEDGGQLEVGVLWLHSRFRVLGSYIVLVLVLGLAFCCFNRPSCCSQFLLLPRVPSQFLALFRRYRPSPPRV